MKCTKCGTDFPAGKFCPRCGTPVSSGPQSQNSLGAQPIPPQTDATRQPETHRPDTYYAPVSKPYQPVMPEKRKKGGPVLAVIALVLVAALVIGAMTVVRYGPLNKIMSAAKKNLDSGSFTMEMKVDSGDMIAEYMIWVEFDPEERILNVYIDAKNDQGARLEMGIYDEHTFIKETYTDGDRWYSYEKCDDELDEFFDRYVEYEDSVERIFDPYRLSSDKEDILFLLDELDDLMEGELGDVFDLDILSECMYAYIGMHNNKDWITENAGFKQEKKGGETIYTYAPDLYDFFSVSMPVFEEAFEDDDVYDDTMDSMDESRSELKAINMELSFGVKSGYLTSARIEVEGTEMEITFSGFGKNELDIAELEDLMDDCKDGYQEQYDRYYG